MFYYLPKKLYYLPKKLQNFLKINSQNPLIYLTDLIRQFWAKTVIINSVIIYAVTIRGIIKLGAKVTQRHFFAF